MKRFEFWKLGLENVLASALRSALTVLGMSIGVAAILAVITLGNAGKAQVKAEIGRLGIDKVLVCADEGSALTSEDGVFLGNKLNTTVDAIVCVPVEAGFSGTLSQAVLVGCGQSYLESLQPEIARGRTLSTVEWSFPSGAALVGSALAKQLRMVPGQWFTAGGIMLRCTGIVEQCQTAAQIDFSHAVIVPSEQLEPWTEGRVHQLSLYVKEGDSPDSVAGKAETLLRERSGISVTATSLQVQAEAADSVLDVFVDVLAWVALICMLVGGIGVTNILLVSVRERRREIGIMQSLGATKVQICGLFLCEAMIYAVTGGFLGLLLGGIITAVAGASISLVPVIRSKDCTVVFFTAVLVGLISGVAPAVQACNLRPIDALRDE